MRLAIQQTGPGLTLSPTPLGPIVCLSIGPNSAPSSIADAPLVVTFVAGDTVLINRDGQLEQIPYTDLVDTSWVTPLATETATRAAADAAEAATRAAADTAEATTRANADATLAALIAAQQAQIVLLSKVRVPISYPGVPQPDADGGAFSILVHPKRQIAFAADLAGCGWLAKIPDACVFQIDVVHPDWTTSALGTGTGTNAGHAAMTFASAGSAAITIADTDAIRLTLTSGGGLLDNFCLTLIGVDAAI